MTKDEQQLMENVLDGLDRLFDRESSPIDLHALIFATSRALQDTEYFTILDTTAVDLETLLAQRLETDEERTSALNVTNDLRLFLARNLPFDPPENS